MKRLYLAIISLTLTLLCSCTQYNGHIGPIFGSWALVGMTEDTLPIDTAYETVFSFQNKVVRVVRLVNPPFSTGVNYGEFTLTDDVLTLFFQGEPTPSGGEIFMTPDWLHFPQGGVPVCLEVRKLTGSEMILSLDNDGKTYVYKFKKTW